MDEVPKCNLKELERYLKEERRVMMVVESTECPACKAFDENTLPVAFENYPEDCGLATVVLDPTDKECGLIADRFAIMAVPTVLGLRDGKELGRVNPTQDAGTNAKQMQDLMQKLREA